MRLLPAIVARTVRLFPVLATGVICLVAFNLGFRLDSEIVREWDESLYATTAWEMHRSGEWIGTTFRGELDYYNSKPPLNFWLIVLSFKAFGLNLIALRLPSVIAAWLTVVTLIWWVRRHIDRGTALFAGLVLSTMFAFFYVHAGRSANTDAINTLLILLTIVTLWSARERPWRLCWLGPVFAGVFLLRGMAILMPLAIVIIYELVTFGIRRRGRWLPSLAAVVIFALPVAAWMVARWRIDQWKFLERVFWYDFFARSVTTIESHPGSVFYYLNILQKNHYDWLAAAVLAWILFPVPWAGVRGALRFQRGDTTPRTLLLIWAAVTLLIPTLMQTKLAWYLNPFYPVFAIAVGAILARAWSRAAEAPGGWQGRRATALVVVLVLALGVAEGKLLWYSYHHRDLRSSSQGFMLEARDELRGRVIYRRQWTRAEIFVVEALVGATHRLAADTDSFLRDSQPGDYLVTRRVRSHPKIEQVRSQGEYVLYRRIE